MAGEDEVEKQEQLPPVKRMRKRPSVWPAVAACGVFTWLMGSLMTPTLGAARAVRLKWDQRRAEIDRDVGAAVEKGRAAGEESRQGGPTS